MRWCVSLSASYCQQRLLAHTGSLHVLNFTQDRLRNGATPGRACFRGAPFGSLNTSFIGTSTPGSAGQVTIPDVLKTAQ